ncbi:MAG: hypothetical protein RLO12_05950 [Fulvivirga sp.]
MFYLNINYHELRHFNLCDLLTYYSYAYRLGSQNIVQKWKSFLVQIFGGDEQLADSVNHLLLVGFYLINIGYAVYTLTITRNIDTVQYLIESLSVKLGAIILILGGMHFFNLYVLFNLRKRALQSK